MIMICNTSHEEEDNCLPKLMMPWLVFLSSGKEDSVWICECFPCIHCLRNTACYLLNCPLYYYLSDFIRFWHLSVDAERHLGLQLVAARSHHGIHPKAYLSSCFVCSGLRSSKKWQRKTKWAKEKSKWVMEENRAKEMMDTVRQTDTVKGKDGKTPPHIILLLLG